MQQKSLAPPLCLRLRALAAPLAGVGGFAAVLFGGQGFGQTLQSAPRAGSSRVRDRRGTDVGRVALALLLLALLLSSGCSLHSAPDVPSGGKKVSGASISKTALSTVGARYTYGGSTPAKGFDCSGLVCWSYGKYGVSMPRTAREQSKVGSSVSKSNLRPGDLVVFKNSGGMHTGIYTGKGRFVHSPGRGKTVRVDNINAKYWKKTFVAGRRHRQLY